MADVLSLSCVFSVQLRRELRCQKVHSLVRVDEEVIEGD